MSRATATILFTDLVGSTELRGRLGEEAADELRRKHDQFLAQAVEANRGSVIKGLGDGIMATFTGAADAVAAAVAIQQGIDRLNRSGKAPVPLSVRVGLSAGDVSFEDDDVHGTPVIEASRLCGAAVGGEILASEIVRWLGGAQGSPSFIPVGSLELKGLAAPVPAGRIEWEPAPVSAIPMPALLTDIGRIFVGRDAELDRLTQLWKEAAAAERRVALLAGEPGVGKTRLAAELAIRAHDEGGVVLAGRCDEDMGVPYQPFVEALRQFVDHTSRSELKDRLGRYAGELVRLVPDLSQQAPDLAPPLRSDPETERYRLFDAVAAWLSAASAEDTLVLVLDDLQWAAKPTLLLLRHIARAADTKRLLILGTYRDTELTHDHPLVEVMADLRRDGVLERFPLSGLDDSSVTAIVEQAAGHALDEDGVALARAIYQETEGNPFFVREVLRHLAETNAIEQEGGQWVTRVPIEQLGIPEGIRDVVGRRLIRLSGEANQALRVAAVVGSEFDIDQVQAAGELSESRLLAALEEAVEARLTSEVSPTRFRFSHALVRGTLYESLTGSRKVVLHRRVAQAIEVLHEGALDDYLPALAHHWAKASAPAADTSRAVDYSRRAGDRALNQLAHDEAVNYYGQALDLLDTAGSRADPRRVELMISLGQAQLRAGDPAHRRTLLDAADLADKTDNADALARAALANYRGWSALSFGVDTERVAFLERAVAAHAQRESPIAARLLANLAVELGFSDQHQRRQDLADEALATARHFDDPTTQAHVLASRYLSLPTTPERHLEVVELNEIADRLNDPSLVFSARAWRALTHLAIGDAPGFFRDLDDAARVADDLGQPNLRWMAAFFRSSAHRMAGRLDEAEAEARRAYAIGQAAGMPDARSIFVGANLFWIRYDQGRLDELLDAYARSASRAGPHPETLVSLGIIHCEAGRTEDARNILEQLAADDFGTVPGNYSQAYALAMRAELCAGVADPAQAATLRHLTMPFRGLIPTSGGAALGTVHHCLALLSTVLGDYDEAEFEFQEAARLNERLAAPTWLARSRLEWARMLLIRRAPGDAERARELLGQALLTARQLGLTNVERRTVTLLQDCP